MLPLMRVALYLSFILATTSAFPTPITQGSIPSFYFIFQPTITVLQLMAVSVDKNQAQDNQGWTYAFKSSLLKVSLKAVELFCRRTQMCALQYEVGQSSTVNS